MPPTPVKFPDCNDVRPVLQLLIFASHSTLDWAIVVFVTLVPQLFEFATESEICAIMYLMDKFLLYPGSFLESTKPSFTEEVRDSLPFLRAFVEDCVRVSRTDLGYMVAVRYPTPAQLEVIERDDNVNPPSAEDLRRFVDRLKDISSPRYTMPPCAFAFTMCSHPRLGASSPFQQLEPEIVRRIATLSILP